MAIYFNNLDTSTTGPSFIGLGSNILNGNPITACCWIKLDKYSGGGLVQAPIVIAGNNSTTNVIRLQLSDTGQVGARINSGTTVYTTDPVPLGIWTHIAIVLYSTTSRSAFINGGGKTSDTASLNSTSTGQARFGSAGATGTGILGCMAEVGLWNVALTDDEIKQLARGTIPRRVRFNNLKYYAAFRLGDPTFDGVATYTNKLFTAIRWGTNVVGRPKLITDHPPVTESRFNPCVKAFIPSASLPERTGTFSVTEANDTLSATGANALSGLSSITEASDTLSSTGTNALSGASNITEASDTLSSSATNAINAAFSATEASDTLSSAGTNALSGSFSATEGNDTLSSSGTIVVTGVFSVTEASDTLNATGTVSWVTITGTFNVTEANDTLSATGTSPITGTFSVTEAKDALYSYDSLATAKIGITYVKNWPVDLPPVGNYKGLAGRLWESSTNHLYTIPGTQTVWMDIDFPLLLRTTGVGRPTLAAWNTDFDSLQWAIGDNLTTGSGEFIHAWKEGSMVTWHIHWVTGVQDGTDRYVKWQVDYTFANFMGIYPAKSTLSAETLIPANTPINTHFLTPIGTFTPTGIRIGAHAKAKVTRIAASGTAPSVNPFSDLLQMHIECDSLGSKTIQNK